MARDGGVGVPQLRQLIFYHIDNDLLDTANFLAGRLHAIDQKNPDSLHLLALTYYRLRRYKAAYDYAHRFGHNGKHLGCAYVFAQACLELKRNQDGCKALESAKTSWQGRSNWNKHSESSRRHLPDAAAVCTLLAKLWRAHGDMKKAGDYYIEAHRASPLTWDAFEGLSKIGADLQVPKMFKLPPDIANSTVVPTDPLVYSDSDATVSHPLATQNNFNQQILTPSSDPFNSDGILGDAGPSFNIHPDFKGGFGVVARHDAWDTPTTNGGVFDEDVPMAEAEAEDTPPDVPAAPARKQRQGTILEQTDRLKPPALRGTASTSSDNNHLGSGLIGQKRTISGQAATAGTSDGGAPPRRSHRLGQSSSRLLRSAADSTSSFASRLDRSSRAPKAATGTKGRTQVGRVVSGNSNRRGLLSDVTEKEKEKRAPSRNGAQPPSSIASVVTQKPDEARALERSAMAALLTDFKTLAVASYASTRFDMPRAIESFKALPAAQLQTPWAMAQLGRAYYEAVDYKNAGDCFARVLKMQPSRTEDMEYYSTVLWHLKDETALACLCHMLKEVDFHSPQTWCAVGNAFSLARDHDQAISAFKRATQIDDNFAYAWTLMGHEFIANEEFEAALTSFRKAVGVDHRGYGGWYGLGKSYERMGKLEDAERHYRIAASINPTNSTLLVCIGVVLERLRNRPGALVHYMRALEVAPTSALARFKKARTLMHMKQFEEAEKDLEILREQAPDEANVWFLLGKCYKGLGKKSAALRALTTALNLDVKAAPFIKEAMEALDVDEESSSDED